MNKLALAAVALLAVIAAVFLLQSGGPGEFLPTPLQAQPPAEAPTTLAGDAVKQAAGRIEAPPGLAPAEESGAPDAREPTPAPGMGAIVGVVRYDADDSPAAGVAVVSEAGFSLLSAATARHTRTDPRGAFRFADLPPGHYKVSADRGGQGWVKVEVGLTIRLELRVPPGATIVGVVRDAQSGPIAGAVVWLSERSVHDVGAEAATTDRDGRFELRHVPTERWIGARARAYRSSPLRYLKIPPGQSTTIEIVLMRGDARVHGRVFAADGRPAVGAAVLGRAAGGAQWSSAPDGSAMLSSAPRTAQCDGKGEFTLEGLPPGAISVQARAADSGVGEGSVVVTAGGLGDVVVNLPAGARLSGRVTELGGPPSKQVSIYAHHTERTLATQWVGVEPDGTFDAVVSPGTMPVQVWQEGHAVVQDELALAPGEARIWNPAIGAKAYVRGRVVDSLGRALEDFSVAAFADGKWIAEATTSATGEFALDKLEGDKVMLRVGVRPEGGAENARLTALTQEVVPPQDALELVIPVDRVPNAGARGRVLSAIGMPLAGALVRFGGEAARGLADAHTKEDGTFALGRLVPGSYWVTVQHEVHPTLHLGRHELTSNAALDLGDLTLVAGGTVVATVQRSDGGDASAVRLHINDARGSRVSTLVGEVERRSGPVPPGDLALEITGTGIAAARHPIAVVAGQETRVTVVVQPGRRHTVRATLPVGATTPRWVAATVFDAERHPVGGIAMQRDAEGVWVGEVWLGAGTYTLAVGSDGSSLHAQVDLQVAPGGGDAVVNVSLQAR